MKNLALALAMTLLLAACSSGSTVAPQDVTLNGVFTGTFENTDGNQGGTATFNFSQATDSTAVSGNAIFDTTTLVNTCLVNGTFTGTNNGANLTITIGASNIQLAISNNGNTLSGTYVTEASTTCSSGSGSGTITLNR